jgi:hypothetical protein
MKIGIVAKNKKNIDRFTIFFMVTTTLLLIIGIQNKITIVETFCGFRCIARKAKAAIRRVAQAAAKLVTALFNKIKKAFDVIINSVKVVGEFIKRSFYAIKLVIQGTDFGLWASDAVENLMKQFKTLPSRLPNYITAMMEIWIKQAFESIKNMLKATLIIPIKNILAGGQTTTSNTTNLITSFPSRILEIILCPIIHFIKNVVGIPININSINNKCYGNNSILGISGNITKNISQELEDFFKTFGNF